jgi:hypothetical protein
MTLAVGPAVVEALQLCLLIRGEQTVEAHIDIALNFCEPCSLIGREIDHALNGWREHLAGLLSDGRGAAAASTSMVVRRWAAPARTRTAVAVEPRGLGYVQGLQFSTGYDSVVVGIGAIEELKQAVVRNFASGELSVVIGIVGHHSGYEGIRAGIGPRRSARLRSYRGNREEHDSEKEEADGIAHRTLPVFNTTAKEWRVNGFDLAFLLRLTLTKTVRLRVLTYERRNNGNRNKLVPGGVQSCRCGDPLLPAAMGSKFRNYAMCGYHGRIVPI